MDESEFIEVAKELLSDDATEAELRSSASRAYYATYHLCKNLADKELLELPANDDSKGVHSQLISRYVYQANTKLKSIGYMLKASRDIRVNSDYDLEKLVMLNDAHTCLAYYERICEKVDELNKQGAS